MSLKYTNNFKQVKSMLNSAKAEALHTVAVFMDGEAVVRAPVDTGNLRNSIGYEVDVDEGRASVGASAEYAAYVEFGTYKTPAQPFIVPAGEGNISKIDKMLKTLYGSHMKG